MIGVNKGTIHNWERNKHPPRIRHIPRIHEFLGYEVTDPPASLADHLLAYRKCHGLLQRAMAKRLRIDPATLGRYERGDRIPTGAILARMIDLLPITS